MRSGLWFAEIERGRRLRYVVLEHGPGSMGAAPPVSTSIVVATGPARRTARALGLAPAVRRPVSAWSAPAGRTALDAGRRRWAGLDGRLLLTRSRGPFPQLVAFTWRDGIQRRVIALGAWGPFPRAVAALQAIVGRRRAAPGAGVRPSPPVAGIAMTATPRWLRLLCPRECPARLPRAGSGFTLVQVSPLRHGRALDVAWGGESGHPRLDRPPRLVHLTVADGRHAGRPGMTLGGPGCFGNHLCSRRRGGPLISLHAWRPLRQARAVFAAVLRSVPGA
jgi:hypothetical protein